MKVLNYILLLVLVLFTNQFVFGQSEFETERAPDNYNQNAFGIKLNSDGVGLLYHFSTRINYRNRNIYLIELNTLKSSKEIKVVNPYFDALSSRKFVYGKTHSVMNLKVAYGWNRMIFDKREKNSISINLSANTGLSFAISKPIYYEIIDSVVLSGGYVIAYTSYNKMDLHLQSNPTDIIGKAPFILGLNEFKLHPGIFLRLSASTDFSQNVMKVRILETGVSIDYYIIPIEIMASKSNNLFLSLFVSYQFGNKYDSRLNREYRKELKKAK